jgi:hypothetical protein
MHNQHTWLIQRQPAQVLGTTPHDRDKTLGTVDMRAKPPVALLRHKETAHSVTTVQRQKLVLQLLQRRLGNTYVRRILEAQRGAIPVAQTSGHYLSSTVKRTASRRQSRLPQTLFRRLAAQANRTTSLYLQDHPPFVCKAARAPDSMGVRLGPQTW